LKLKLSHVLSHPNLPFARGQIEKFLILKHLPFINFVLVEIDKVPTQGYYGCEENMNINHSWIAILIHIMHSKMASLIAKLRSSTIIVDQSEWNHESMGQYVYFVSKDHNPMTKIAFS
jgi:hypothetical protein